MISPFPRFIASYALALVAGIAAPAVGSMPASLDPDALAPTQSDPQVVEVTVTGFGSSPQAALDDAIRNALKQVAGEFIRSDTEVDGDEIVQDRVIAHAQGFVESAAKLGEPVLKDGIYRQRVLVKVRKSQVAEVMRGPAKSEGAADGLSMYARLKSLRERKASAAELMSVLFEGFPASVLKCEIAEGPVEIEPGQDPSIRVPQLPAGQAFVLVKVDIMVDAAKWREWCRGAREVLGAVSEASQRIRWNPKSAGARRVSLETGVGPEFIRYFAGGMSDAAASAEHLCLNARTSVTLAQSLFSLQPKARPAAPGSIKSPATSSAGGLRIGLLESLGGELEAFVVPWQALARWDAATPHGAPTMTVGLFDGSGAQIAAPSVGATGGVPRAALVFDNANYLVASPAFVSMFSENLALGSQRAMILMPALESGCFDYSNPNDDFDGQGVAASRMTMPFGFIVPMDELPRIKSARAELGKTVPRNPGFADTFREGFPRR
ncbi:MAG: hypothetical protein LW636_12655, partial [Planctomycetaceae bacterium]|nr:hypothetical protein [Planctomycetaceae bacterium]